MTTIITNNVPRDWLYEWELSEAQQKEARSDYEWAFKDDSTPRFFIYKDQLYCEYNFLAVNNHFWNPNPPEWQRGWDGYNVDTFFSAVLIRYPREEWGEWDSDRVVVGLAIL